MGEKYIAGLKTKIKAEWKPAFVSVLVFGLIAHIYKFTNTLLIHDSLFFVCSDLENLSSGRWLLPAAGVLSSYFDLPWINGLLSLFYIGITAAVIADIFRMKNRIVIVLSSAMLVTFPSITNTFFYEYTADAYMLAMLLAALSVRLSMPDMRGKKFTALSALFVCLCCGIYQCYLSFALILTLCLLMTMLLENRMNSKELRGYILRLVLIYAVGVALYYAVWKGLMLFTAAEASTYQGMNGSGEKLSLLSAAKNCLYTVAKLFLGWNVAEHGWTVYALLNVLFLASAAVCIVNAAVRTSLCSRPAQLILFLLCLAAIPFAACIFFFVSPGVFYHPLMLQSMAVFYILIPVLAEKYLRSGHGTVISLIFVLLIGRNILNANICYHEMEITMERSRSMATEILTRVHALDDGTVERIVFVDYDNPSRMNEMSERLAEAAFSGTQLRTHLLYYNEYAQMYLHEILACDYTAVGFDGVTELDGVPEIEEMGTWPENDSVRKFGNTVVIKLPLEELSYE